ncbi:HD-GYP domain-containing protein [Aquabacterium humicola]|uniref:HD-GYP domain-containing protein n=1 Tax=Aquabacterium humicola TaxID=3237377 RepID=UPI002543453A|nr:HD domain-containing phosphohydrolase [Rubrivivax pictus]
MVDETPSVNEHYLDRVVEVSETTTVEAIEDIVSGNGIKLVAKGAQIDARVRDRLLQHKLRKPLETSVRVVDGVASRPMEKVADLLFGRHALLAGVCGEAGKRAVAAALRELRLSTPLESLLSVYAAQGPQKLEHAVGVGLLAAALMHELAPADAASRHTLLVAGLLHDAGELYIDPAILRPGLRLTHEQWKHIAAHPIVAARVLREMPGAGPAVADAVLNHHERLDGFGYPQGLAGPKLPLAGQVLGLAEMLMGVIESGRSPGERASVAVKLIPGEFDRRLLGRVASIARVVGVSDVAAGDQAPVQPDELAAHAVRLAAALNGLNDLRATVERRVVRASAALQALLEHAIERCRRIRMAYSSTGLDFLDIDAMRAQVAAMDARTHCEIAIVMREVEWRLREVEREARIRAERLPPGERVLVRQLIDDAKEAARRATDAALAVS